jgi:hypothetical protein
MPFQRFTDQSTTITITITMTAAVLFELDDVLHEDLVWMLDDIVTILWHPNVISIFVFRCRRLDAQTETAHKHVLPTSAVSD